MAAIRLTRTHRVLIAIVVSGAVVIAGIGFAGSYAAVRTLALHKGFGWFANVFPIGVDAGIVVLLALDLLLTWLRIPFPLLRQTAWLLTAATIAFNGAAAWPDPLGVGMHAIIPVLFVVSVEAARHAIGRIADITADKHMESVRITRWLLAPVPTFRLWRRMKLWELRSYEETIRREQDRLVYRARLRARYGVAWRRKAPIEAIMPLRLAKYGVPLTETAEAGLEAAGIEITKPVRQLEPATAAPVVAEAGVVAEKAPVAATAPATAAAPAAPVTPQPAPAPIPVQQAPVQQQPAQHPYQGPEYEQPEQHEQYSQAQYDEQRAYEAYLYEQQWQGAPHDSPWFAAQRAQQAQQAQQVRQAQAQAQAQQAQQVQQVRQAQQVQQPPQVQQGQQVQQVWQAQQVQQAPQVQQVQEVRQPAQAAAAPEPAPTVMVPAGPNRNRPLGNGLNGHVVPAPRAEEFAAPAPAPELIADPEPEPVAAAPGLDIPDGIPLEEAYFAAYRQYVRANGAYPNVGTFARYLTTLYSGTPPHVSDLGPVLRDLRYRFESEMDIEPIP